MSKAAYLHGSFGSGKSHFMAILHLILAGDAHARSIPELAPVIAKHNAWMEGKKFLLAPYHMVDARDLESAVLGGYADHASRLHPEATLAGVQGLKHYFAWTNNLTLNDSVIDVLVNYLLYEKTDKDGKITRWTWVTNLPLTQRSVAKVMRAGRARWKIENETFNTLKNQGYHFEHNYGHGTKHLATDLALLMFLAFTIDQIQQRCCRLFRALHQGVRTKVKVWSSIRNLFSTLVFKSMEALYRHMASLYRIQLE